jgi:hypothetical protein
MFNSPILDTVITLVFIYLVLDILASSIQEFISQQLKSRGKMLQSAISEVLDDRRNKNFGYLLYQNPMIDLLRRDQKDLPSYIDSDTFAKALIELIGSESTVITYTQDPLTLKMIADVRKIADPLERFKSGVALLSNSDLKRLLEGFLDGAGSTDTLRDSVAGWYDKYMDRVAGWYKRSLKTQLVIISVFMTILLNINFIKIAGSVYKDGRIASRIVPLATAFAAQDSLTIPAPADLAALTRQIDSALAVLKGTDTSAKAKSAVVDSIVRRGTKTGQARVPVPGQVKDSLPIGWNFSKKIWPSGFTFGMAIQSIKADGIGYTFFGWLLSVIILSFGAPFWFDILKKLVNARNAGVKPKTSKS